MNHLDLFSGIGGFAYAVDQVWENAEHIFCDNDKFCRQVLKKHWPNSKIYEDIKEIKSIADTEQKGLQGETGGQKKGIRGGLERCYLLTGGFPCQPFSQAGRRKGTADDRYLWPEMFRVIRLAKPRWVIAENVRGLLTWNEGMVLEQVCLDLETAGYEVQPFIIPAVAVNASHRRDRVWIIAHRTSERPDRRSENESRKQSSVSRQNIQQDITKSKSGESGKSSEQKGREDFERRSWERNWLEVATELCGVDDGLPAELDGLKFTKAGHRVQRLKTLGNAIVPQVAEKIMRAIKEVDEL